MANRKYLQQHRPSVLLLLEWSLVSVLSKAWHRHCSGPTLAIQLFLLLHVPEACDPRASHDMLGWQCWAQGFTAHLCTFGTVQSMMCCKQSDII